MTDKEFKRLNRAQLIEIIYQLQLQVDELTEQKQALESALEDRRLRIHNAGNIADAALELNDCFRSAQNAAEQYLNEIKALCTEAEEERQRLLADARAEAAEIIENAKKERASQKFSYATEFERLWVNMQITGEET
jgi:cell division septum initiation protein DivIVA